MGQVLKTFSSHVFRSSILVAGLITIYLNILRTSVIIWPMVRFRKRPLHASLIFFMVVFIGIEAFVGVFYTYPLNVYLYEKEMGGEASPPFTLDDPYAKFFSLAIPIFGTPIILLVALCCLVSAAKLLRPNKTLREGGNYAARRHAAITVLTLGFLYVVCNTVGLTLCSIFVYHSFHGGQTEASKYILHFSLSGTSLVLNSALNPIVYICRVKKLQQHFMNIARCFCLKRREKGVDRRTHASNFRETSR